MNNSSIKILVCYYKQVFIKLKNPIYFDIQCGKDETNIDLGMIADNTGDNISIRNQYWSEITGLYWAWKNMKDLNYIGLCSYRRFFNFKKDPLSAIRIIPLESIDEINSIVIPDVEHILTQYDVIIPKRYTYAYNIREVCSMNYKDADFDLLEEIIHQLSPDYDVAYHSIFHKSNKLIGHNMFIMSWKNFDDYCNWVFLILFEMERRIDPTNYPINQIRVFGYMHELLLAVFIEKNNLKKYYSQVTWATDEISKSRFNNLFYKIASTILFFLFKNRNFRNSKFFQYLNLFGLNKPKKTSN